MFGWGFGRGPMTGLPMGSSSGVGSLAWASLRFAELSSEASEVCVNNGVLPDIRVSVSASPNVRDELAGVFPGAIEAPSRDSDVEYGIVTSMSDRRDAPIFGSDSISISLGDVCLRGVKSGMYI